MKVWKLFTFFLLALSCSAWADFDSVQSAENANSGSQPRYEVKTVTGRAFNGGNDACYYAYNEAYSKAYMDCESQGLQLVYKAGNCKWYSALLVTFHYVDMNYFCK